MFGAIENVMDARFGALNNIITIIIIVIVIVVVILILIVITVIIIIIIIIIIMDARFGALNYSDSESEDNYSDCDDWSD